MNLLKTIICRFANENLFLNVTNRALTLRIILKIVNSLVSIKIIYLKMEIIFVLTSLLTQQKASQTRSAAAD